MPNCMCTLYVLLFLHKCWFCNSWSPEMVIDDFPECCEGPGPYAGLTRDTLPCTDEVVRSNSEHQGWWSVHTRLSLPVMFWPHRHEWVKRQWYQHRLNNISMLNHKSQIWSLIMKVIKEITLTWPSLCSRLEVVFRCGLWLSYFWDDSVSPI